MKKLIQLIALVAVSSTLSFANPTPSAAGFNLSLYNVANTHKVKVFFEKKKTDNLKITVKDENGKEVYSQYYGKKEIKAAMCIDLSQLKEGKYTLEATNYKETVVRELDLISNTKVERKILI